MGLATMLHFAIMLSCAFALHQSQIKHELKHLSDMISPPNRVDVRLIYEIQREVSKASASYLLSIDVTDASDVVVVMNEFNVLLIVMDNLNDHVKIKTDLRRIAAKEARELLTALQSLAKEINRKLGLPDESIVKNPFTMVEKLESTLVSRLAWWGILLIVLAAVALLAGVWFFFARRRIAAIEKDQPKPAPVHAVAYPNLVAV